MNERPSPRAGAGERCWNVNGITVEEVTFRYRRRGFRLDIPHLEFATGKVTALVGPNGAGKTTLLHLLAGLVVPDTGRVLAGGRPVVEWLRDGRIGFCPDSFPPQGRQRLETWLRWVLELRRRRKPSAAEIEALADLLGMREHLDRPFSRLSRGQAKRAGLLLALAGDPPVVLLDEPTAYLDPGSVLRLRETIHHLRERGVTVVISSHHLAELQKLADDAVFLARGRIARGRRGGDVSSRWCELVVSAWPGQARAKWTEAAWSRQEDGRILVRVSCSTREELARIEGFLEGLGERVYAARMPGESLEEDYREWVGG